MNLIAMLRRALDNNNMEARALILELAGQVKIVDLTEEQVAVLVALRETYQEEK